MAGKSMRYAMRGAVCGFLAVFSALLAPASHAEVVLQYFNTSWKEIADKMPELAEVGYGALWLPPPTKGSGGLSVGYDLWDPFDLGAKDQRGTVKTRYGTEAELLRLIEVAHRFGLRVYFDNIMNHRAFDVPGYNENTPIDIYPGLVPEDFHLRVTEDGFYRKWDNVSNWNDAWQVQNRNFSDLIDIAQETPNANFGRTEGSTHPKIYLVRQPSNPEFYDYHPTLGRVGFYNTNITASLIASNTAFYSEDVWMYLMRSVRWLVDRTKVDGLRLDAVKHVPSYFFGKQSGGDKDTSADGYTGQAQEQFNITRGFSDPNHRDSVFNTEVARDDLMMFGEHLGSPPGFQEYIDAGMRLVDATLKNELNYRFGNPSASLGGLDLTGFSGNPAFNDATSVMFAKSHDDDYASRTELHYGYYLTRRGLPNIYTDGNYQSETLAQSGGAFPRHANTAFLGQFGDKRIPNLVYIHEHFARDDQYPVWSDGDYLAYERRDNRENPGMTQADAAVLLFLLNDNYASGQARPIANNTAFPHVPFAGPGSDAYLYNYSSYGGGFFVWASQLGSVVVPPGGYFAFSWRSPEPSDLWGGAPVELYQGGVPVTDRVAAVRRDGPSGDPGFNPYGVPDANASDYSYTLPVPRITSPTNLRFAARADGSAVNVLMKLDGGWDLNSQMGLGDLGEAAKRDNPPGINPVKGLDDFLGYEQARFVSRQFREKFAARDTSSNNVIGSAGAETYIATIGTAGFTVNTGETGRDSDADTAAWVFHDPQGGVTASNQASQLQFEPSPETAGGSNLTLWVKVGYSCQVSRGFVYYTTDGSAYPEGAGGEGIGSTRVAELAFVDKDQADGNIDWWKGTIPALANGAQLRYKIGLYKQQGGGCNTDDWTVVFPSGPSEVSRKKSMMGVWEIADFDASSVVYRPHNDYGASATGLAEGMHVLRARAFLERAGRASIYNTFVQTFYYDVSTPTGQVVFPAHDGDTLGSREYGAVVRTDPTVRQVWYSLLDGDPANDDSATGITNGNGAGAWAQAVTVTPSLSVNSPYPDEWRFTYRNIPSSGNATMLVRLAEISSSTNLALDDAQGHFTTLQRIVTAAAPTQELFVAYPEYDGKVINDQEDYVLQAFFSKSLPADTGNFLVRIDGSAQPRSSYGFYFDVSPAHHALAYPLPDLFNGDTNFLHVVEVAYTTEGGVTLQASRYFRSKSEALGPYVAIVNPPEVDSVGRPFEIVLPDVANPTPGQRSYPIQVETDLSASNAWIVFANNAGSAGAFVSTETPVAGLADATQGSSLVTARDRPLSGTVTVTFSNNLVVGEGTLFSNEVSIGATLRIDTNSLVVTQVVSDTSLELASLYPGASASNLAASVQPRFDVELPTGTGVRIYTNFLQIFQVLSPTSALLNVDYPGPTASNLTVYRIDPNPRTSGSRRYWSFLWTNIVEQGWYTFFAHVDTNGDTGTVEATATRNTRVVFREAVTNASPDDPDNDDDGLYDVNEQTSTNHPGQYKPNSETWVNGDLHIYNIYGKTDPLSPDSDGDGLPDGLESGWRTPISSNPTNGTDTAADTDGDGFPNFIGDLDPPFYNTLDNYPCVPSVNSATEGGDRSKLVRGTMTDPNNPDSDYDGVPDGLEDLNRNGWVDGDGLPLYASQDKCSRTNWPDRVWDPGWVETDPNNADTDMDGASDGYGEDVNFNGGIDGDADSNRVWQAGELWQETNPLDDDTDDDGLPDGWERRYNFDPFDDGVAGHTNLHTGALVADALNGAAGNPDGDFIIIGGLTNDYSNLLEYQNGTNPRLFDSGAPPPTGAVTIGRGPPLGAINGVTNFQEFTDWTWDDLVALDEYEGDGPNNQGGDLYLAWDGFDSSRDIVAFYAHDGGDVGQGGDGKFYFRVDFEDLQPYAEEGYLDLYVVVDTGNPADGEAALPDDVDLLTSNRWEAVVALYQSSSGRVYVDTNPNSNSTTFAHGSILTAFGVEPRDQNTPDGFGQAYFNSELDAVEFSISRQALRDAGWNGFSITSLNFQVFTTKDGACNGCGAGGTPGAGDIGGRNDVRDTIYDDQVAEDYWQSQPSIQNSLASWFRAGTVNNRRAKVAMVVHGNQAIQPGSVVQDLINNGEGAGYHRALAIHDVYRQPLNLHVTPTLASAIQWARADTNAGVPWRDGPAFNAWIRGLAATNNVRLLGSTFSDHAMPYFTREHNRDNVELAGEFLRNIYGVTSGSSTVFWTPERVLDADVFSKILDAGFGVTLIDQNTHLFNWFGRTTALGDRGYQINRIHGVKCFVMNEGASAYRFANHDGGLPLALRTLFSRKARSGSQDQVVTMLGNWEDFGVNANADAYDANVRWIANRPWVALVALEDVAAGLVDINHDGSGDGWYVQERGAPALSKQSHEFINHASEVNYDNWYNGSPQEEGLFGKVFEIRPGTNVPSSYGMMFTPGIVTETWSRVASIADTNLAKLGRGAFHASVFETAFHSEDNNNLEKFSVGTYVYPDTTFDAIAPFARQAQAQTRVAAVYERVDDWAAAAGSITNVQMSAEDVDLDGEAEYLLFNDRVLAILERIGGRMIGAWVRDIRSGRVYQVLGNPVAFAGADTEEEGVFNVATNGAVAACRTSGLKDWFAGGGGGVQYNNMLYALTEATNGWRAISEDGAIEKTIALAPKSWRFEVHYSLSGPLGGQPLYVRHGLSPNLYDLLLRGQAGLGDLEEGGGLLRLTDANYEVTVEASVGYADGGHTAGFNPAAVDDNPGAGIEFDTVNMRNQAQTHQVEIVGTNSFSFSLGFRAFPTDGDGDGIPNTVEDDLGLDSSDPSDGSDDADLDGVANADEYVAGTDLFDVSDYLRATQTGVATGIVVRFPTSTQREYFIWYANAGLAGPPWIQATTGGIPGTGLTYEWLDDGSLTAPHPFAVTNRFYRIEVDLPP
jgi:glycosidase